MNPEFNNAIIKLKKIKFNIKEIKKEIISETLIVDNIDFSLRRTKKDFSKIDVLLKKIKRKNTEKINPTMKKYNVFQLLELYPYYYLKQEQKNIINKNIEKIIKEESNDEKVIFNLFLYLFFEKKNQELNNVFKILAKKKHLKSLEIMESYFLFNNHVVNYNKVKKLINNIKNID